VTSFSSEKIALHFSRVVVAVEIVSLAHTAFESHLYSYLLFLILYIIIDDDCHLLSAGGVLTIYIYCDFE
jgi:hypothetical protein